MISAANHRLLLNGNNNDLVYWYKYSGMYLLRKCLLPAICILWLTVTGTAQVAESKPLKVAVFAPVYLDSVFNGPNYKPGNTHSLPRYMLPGLDFYNGVMLAVDSLNAELAPVELQFYDSKSIAEPIDKIVQQPQLANASLIIAAFNSRNDIRPLADFARNNNIPLISATYPNDGGLAANPFFALVNPTLRTHCEGLYKYLQRVYPTSSMVLFRRKGPVEDMVQGIFTEMGHATQGVPLKIKIVDLPDEGFTTRQVTAYLDSTRQNIVICGSLNETFGINLVKALDESKNFPSIAIGMPTWDALKDMDDKGIELVYSTPFIYNYLRKDKTGQQLIAHYRARYQGRPSDMAFKGFEATYHFTKLLLKHNKALVNNLSDKDFKLFNEFDFQPVHQKKESPLPDYLENKKLYFIRKINGQLKSVN